MIKKVSALMILLILLLCIGLSSVNSGSLMNGTQSGKSIIFLWTIGIISVLALIRFWLSPAAKEIGLSIIDWLLFAFSLYIIFLNNWAELKHSLLFLELIGLAILYIIIRQQSNQSYLWILMALIVGGVIQAIYGNLQLWGYFPSNHGIFKMTGSFFNPGPYAGYLAAIFPISLGFYLFNLSIGISKQNPFLLKLISYFNVTKTYFQKITPKSHFLSSNCSEKFTTEKQEKKPNAVAYNIMKSLALISLISMCLVLPASRSRAAWLAVLVSSVYLISVKCNLYQRVRPYFNTLIKKVSLFVFLIIFLTIVGTGLYHLKKGSSDGRLLIWKVSTEMIKGKPISGYGYDGFKKKFMDYQAEYFTDNPDEDEAMLAGDNNFAFNEPIQLMVENGVIGIFPIIAIVLLVFFRKFETQQSKESEEEWTYNNISLSPLSDQIPVEQTDIDWVLLRISRAVVLSILVFGLFSYPLQILPIKICLVVALAITASILRQKENANAHQSICPKRSIRFTVKSIISVGCLWMFWLATGQIQHIQSAYTDWKNAFDLYNIGIYDECLTDYGKAYPVLKTNGDFLTNYGKALSMAEKHFKAVDVLQQAAKYYPNTLVYTALGDSYKKLGQTALAEQVYLHAWHMAPARFYPLYLLAKELLSKEVKIESTAVKEIQEEMRKIIEKSEAEILNEGKIHTDKNLGPIYKGTKEGAYRSVVLTAKFMLQKWQLPPGSKCTK